MADYETVRQICLESCWPGVEEGTSYGTPAFKVKGKFFLRLREPDILVLRYDLDEKELLMLAEPETYFETDHYKGYPAFLIRLSNMSADELKERLARSWRMLATKKMLDTLP